MIRTLILTFFVGISAAMAGSTPVEQVLAYAASTNDTVGAARLAAFYARSVPGG